MDDQLKRLSVKISLNSIQQKVVLAGLILFLLMCLFPPWVHTIDYGQKGVSVHSEKPAGYGFLFVPPKPKSDSAAYGIRLDLTRLFIQFLFLLSSTLFAFVLTQDKAAKEKEVIDLTELVYDGRGPAPRPLVTHGIGNNNTLGEKPAWPKEGEEIVSEEDLVIVDENNSVARTDAFSVAKKWAYWLAGIGAMVGISAAMKGSGGIVGKLLLGAAAGGILALILGGVTFLSVYGVLRLRGR